MANFWSKISNFIILCFKGKQTKTNSFKTLQIEKKTVQTGKASIQGIVHGFGEKCLISSLFVFKQSRLKKVLLEPCRQKSSHFKFLKYRFKKVEIFHYFNVVSPWFWSKISNFFTLFLLRQNRPKQSVYILIRNPQRTSNVPFIPLLIVCQMFS